MRSSQEITLNVLFLLMHTNRKERLSQKESTMKNM